MQKRWCIYWCLNMLRAPSCPSSGAQYKADNAYGVQHWPCCSRLEEKRWFGVHLLGLVSPIPTSAHRTTSSPRHQSQHVHTEPPLLLQPAAARPVLYTKGVVGFVLCSWWWALWCPKHVETPINTLSFLHLVGYLLTFMIQDAQSHEIKISDPLTLHFSILFIYYSSG
jgi:hypothetical protein